MRIGELGEKAGLSAKTIRYYEDIRILPEPDRTSSGYRDYDDVALERLRFIKSAQAVGFSLGEIREVLAFGDRGERPACTSRSLWRSGSEASHSTSEVWSRCEANWSAW